MTGDERYLDAAELGLHSDIAAGVTLADGVFHIRSGSRHLLYLDGGSAGVAMVMQRFLTWRRHSSFEQVLNSITTGLDIPFVLQPGLFQGRAGLIAAATALVTPSEVELRIGVQARRLSWHAIDRGGDTFFPGSGLTRLSTDMATGAAGVLLALNDLFVKGRSSLPFLSGDTST